MIAPPERKLHGIHSLVTTSSGSLRGFNSALAVAVILRDIGLGESANTAFSMKKHSSPTMRMVIPTARKTARHMITPFS